MISHNLSVDSPNSSQPPLSLKEQHNILTELRQQLLLQYRPTLQQGAGPIRVMARMVGELERQCRAFKLSDEVISLGIVNRTIGDIDLRKVIEYEGEPGGSHDYRMLADELGIALPDEDIHGYKATGKVYLWLRDQMLNNERLLLSKGIDLRVYDLLGIGNPILRGWLAEEMKKWKVEVPTEQVYLSLGAMDGIDKTLRGLRQMYRDRKDNEVAVLFPAPGFTVPDWQARSYGYRLHPVSTSEEAQFKLTPAQLKEALESAPDIRIIYLTVTNNPTAFAYTPAELNALHEVLREQRAKGRDVLMLADLAYIGTGKPADDLARMETFVESDVLRSTVFVSSFSKTHTLTGERFGWVTIGDPAIAAAIGPGWTNSMASLPSEWQLRFMSYFQFIKSHPELDQKLRNFYRLRRQRFIAQLERVNKEQPLFEHIYIDDDATVYNWSKLREGEDAFSLFEKTGIAGVPGSGFGYTDRFIRFSIGVIPVIH